MEFKIYDKTAKVYELKVINEPLIINKKIKFYTNYNLGKKLGPNDFFETLLVFSAFKIVLIIRKNDFLETVEIHKCFFSIIENSIKDNQQYHIINSFMIESIECQFNRSYTPFFLDSQYFYFIINQEIIQYNLASLITSQNSTPFILKKHQILSPVYLRDDFIYLKFKEYLYYFERYGYQVSYNIFIFNIQQINLQIDTFQAIKFEINLPNLKQSKSNLIQKPFIKSVVFEINTIILEIYFPFQNCLIKQNYSLSENCQFYFIQEETEKINYDMELSNTQIWNIEKMYDQVYSLQYY